MTSRSDDFAKYRQPNLEQQDTEDDCFELLSAYIDGEATSAERQQVQQLLDNDPEIKKIYIQLIKLQSEMQSLDVPISQDISPEVISQQVFAEVKRSRNQRKLCLWGGGVIAATIIAAISGVIPGFNYHSLKLAVKSPASQIKETMSEPVMVAVTLNQPTVTIPKAAISTFPVDVDSNY
ncbi:MAG: hypothetical protein QNJ55_05895 [Xenococcus sp. MO_188.B8]|nr:hypothetical protein [Xenococcus sp. MO_188.B8]